MSAVVGRLYHPVARTRSRMVDNDPPTEEEVDRMVELYEDDRTVREVAEHDDIDYSRTTVNKWINRRQLEEEGTDNSPEPEPEPADTGDYRAGAGGKVEQGGGPVAAGEDDGMTIEEQFGDILEDEPPTPNDILWDVLETDPGLKEKHVEYLRQFEDRYGVFSPDDVAGKLGDLKIGNKRMTINRAVSNYRTEINRKLQKNEELAKREEWALLLTKTTGNPRYLREADGASNASQFEEAGPAIEGPAAGQQQARSDQIQAPPPGSQRSQDPQQNSHGQQPQQNGTRRAVGQAGGQPQQGYQQQAGQPTGSVPAGAGEAGPQQPGQQQGINEFQQKILEMLEQQIERGNEPTQPSPDKSDSLTSQIQEIAEIQETLDSMGTGGSPNEEVAAAIEQINQKVDSRLAQLEAKVAESGGSSDPDPSAMPSGEGGGTLTEIAALAQQIEDPDVLSTVIESQMDPEVIEAKAKTEEIGNEAQFKKALAEALSPAATEKAIEAFSNLTSGINTAAQQAGQPQGQPRQAQQPTQPQQPQQQQQAQPADRSVEVVDDQQAQQEEPAMSDPEAGAGESSPLREQGEEEMAETDTPDDGEEEVEE